jgi:hypothetical protein
MKVKKILLVLIVVVAVSLLVGYFIKNFSNKFQNRLGWQTMNEMAYTLQYPSSLPTKYMNAVEWPPKFAIYPAGLKCVPSGSAISEKGIIEKKTINGHEYCVTTQMQGAAGSTYTHYDYLEAKGEKKTVALSFVVRASQCENYDDPEKTACKTERATYSIDELADEILSSVKFK